MRCVSGTRNRTGDDMGCEGTGRDEFGAGGSSAGTSMSISAGASSLLGSLGGVEGHGMKTSGDRVRSREGEASVRSVVAAEKTVSQTAEGVCGRAQHTRWYRDTLSGSIGL